MTSCEIGVDRGPSVPELLYNTCYCCHITGLVIVYFIIDNCQHITSIHGNIGGLNKSIFRLLPYF